ncbi:MAG: isoaspartyl peptidase/L-asparaginase [Pseudomonadota bacterium]
MSAHRTTTQCCRSALALAAALLCLLAAPGSWAGGAIPLGQCEANKEFALVLHGGAVWGHHQHPAKVKALDAALAEGGRLLAGGATSLDVVEGAIKAMEDHGAFNAGRGAIANQAGVIELDASIMAGRTRQAGAVAGTKKAKNPIAAARLVMESSPHVLFVGPGADAFVAESGGEVVTPDYFLKSGLNFGDVPLPDELEVRPPGPEVPSERAAYSGTWAGLWSGWMTTMLVVEEITPDGATVVFARGPQEDWGFEEGYWTRAPAVFVNGALRFDFQEIEGAITYRLRPDGKLEATYRDSRGTTDKAIMTRQSDAKGGTVGAVALDRCGDLAAGTSTGGFGSKPPGRVGDSPIIGAGTFADNESAAVSATGHGEYFIRFGVAQDIAARMAYGQQSLAEAAETVVMEVLPAAGGKGGVIALDRAGNMALPYNTDGMLRGWVAHDRSPEVKIYQ